MMYVTTPSGWRRCLARSARCPSTDVGASRYSSSASFGVRRPPELTWSAIPETLMRLYEMLLQASQSPRVRRSVGPKVLGGRFAPSYFLSKPGGERPFDELRAVPSMSRDG